MPVYFRKDFFSSETVRLQPLFAAEASSQGILLYQRADCLLLTVGQIIQSSVKQVKHNFSNVPLLLGFSLLFKDSKYIY